MIQTFVDQVRTTYEQLVEILDSKILLDTPLEEMFEVRVPEDAIPLISALFSDALSAQRLILQEQSDIDDWDENGVLKRNVDSDFIQFFNNSVGPIIRGLEILEVKGRIGYIARIWMAVRNNPAFVSSQRDLHAADKSSRQKLTTLLGFLVSRLEDTETLLADCSPACLTKIPQTSWAVYEDLLKRRPELVRLSETLSSADASGSNLGALFGDELIRVLPPFRSYNIDRLLETLMTTPQATRPELLGGRRLLQWAVDYWDLKIDDFQGDPELADREYWAFDDTYRFLEDDLTWIEVVPRNRTVG